MIRDEVNVKTIEIGTVLSFDTNITPELQEEGLVRDTVREIQAYRKTQNLKPGEPAVYRLAVSPENRSIIEKNRAFIEKMTHTTVEFSSQPEASS